MSITSINTKVGSAGEEIYFQQYPKPILGNTYWRRILHLEGVI